MDQAFHLCSRLQNTSQHQNFISSLGSWGALCLFHVLGLWNFSKFQIPFYSAAMREHKVYILLIPHFAAANREHKVDIPLIPYFAAANREHKVDILADTALCGSKAEWSMMVPHFAGSMRTSVLCMIPFCYRKVRLPQIWHENQQNAMKTETEYRSGSAAGVPVWNAVC